MAWLQKKLTTVYVDRSGCRKGQRLFSPVDIVLKGQEAKLPAGVSFQGKDGTVRTEIRTRGYLSPDERNYGG